MVLGSERHITEEGSHRSAQDSCPGTVLLSSRAPIGYLATAEVPVAVNQEFIAMVCARLGSRVTGCSAGPTTTSTRCSRSSEGTTFEEISKANFRPIPVVVPSAAAIEAFESLPRLCTIVWLPTRRRAQRLKAARHTTSRAAFR